MQKMEVLFLKNPISTSLSFCLREDTLESSLDLAAAAGYHWIDFPIHTVSRPAGSPLRREDWEAWSVALAKKVRDRGLSVWQAHASWEQAVPEDFSLEPPFEIYRRTLRCCAILGCTRLVFHPPMYFYPMVSEALRQRIHVWGAQWFACLAPEAAALGITLELENMFDYRQLHRPGDFPFPYASAADYLDLRQRIGGQGVQFCVDTGHANLSGNDPAEMILTYCSDLGVVHLNDNYGPFPKNERATPDLHLLPGSGNLRWDRIFAALKAVHFTGSLNLEPGARFALLSPAQQVMILRFGREMVAQMAEEAGL